MNETNNNKIVKYNGLSVISPTINYKNYKEMGLSGEQIKILNPDDLKYLYDSVNEITELLANTTENIFKIAVRLFVIKERGLYGSLGFSNIYNLGFDMFSLEKTSVKNYLHIVYLYFDKINEYEYQIKEYFKGFSLTKLVIMSKLTNEQIIDLGLKPTMSCKEIKKVIKEYLNDINIVSDVLPEGDHKETDNDDSVNNDNSLNDDNIEVENKKADSIIFRKSIHNGDYCFEYDSLRRKGCKEFNNSTLFNADLLQFVLDNITENGNYKIEISKI